jgi:hypothetical protein
MVLLRVSIFVMVPLRFGVDVCARSILKFKWQMRATMRMKSKTCVRNFISALFFWRVHR